MREREKHSFWLTAFSPSGKLIYSATTFLPWCLNKHLLSYSIDWRPAALQEFYKPSHQIDSDETSRNMLLDSHLLHCETSIAGLLGPYCATQSNKFSFNISPYSTSSTPLENPDQYRGHKMRIYEEKNKIQQNLEVCLLEEKMKEVLHVWSLSGYEC